MKSKKIIFIGVVVVFSILGAIAAKFLFSTQGHFSAPKKILYIREDVSAAEFTQTLIEDSIVSNEIDFEILLKIKGVKTFKSGRYAIQQGIRTNALINKLRAGLQEPLLVKVDGVRDIYALSGSLAKQLSSDSISFLEAMSNEDVLQKNNLQKEEAMSLIIPNTYELFWNISPEKFMEKMMHISNQYWTTSNLKKAENLGLTRAQVYTLASIVKGETVRKEEATKIAGLYLNRLRIGMALGADPTITFALNLKGAQRVYSKYLAVESPYNTYKNKGLPPGPIFMVEAFYLDAVLNAEKHDFIYMCAQPGRTGLHNFTESYQQHLTNARKYQSWADANDIK